MFRVKIDLEDSPMVLDLPLDQNQEWKSPIPCSGWWGKARSEDVWPLIVWQDGKVDFGANRSENFTPERFAHLEMAQPRYLPGATINMLFKDEIWRGVIKQVRDVG